jgi:HEAT repeat protein
MDAQMDQRFKNNNPIDVKPLLTNRGARLLIASCGTALALAFCLLLKPATARAAWMQFTRIIQRKVPAGVTDTQGVSDSRLAALRPQQQAEILLEAAVDRSPRASEQILTHASAWRGRLTPTPRLSGLLNTALNSDNLQVRTAAIESELATNNLAKNSRTADELIERIESDPAARPWGLWMLGALGNRGVEPDAAFAILVKYSRNSDEKTRFWAVEGLSLLGSDQSIGPLLDVLRNDASDQVRERAACALAQSGMLNPQQRRSAVPSLIDYAGDSSLNPTTHTLVYHALRDITGATVENDPSAWRNYWTDTASR